MVFPSADAPWSWVLVSGPWTRPHLCGGPTRHAGPSPAGSQPVSHPEEAGLRPQHRRGHVQAEGHAVVTPCGEKNPHVNSRISHQDQRSASALANFLRPSLYRGWPSSTAERRAALWADGTSSPRSVRAGPVFHPPSSTAASVFDSKTEISVC